MIDEGLLKLAIVNQQLRELASQHEHLVEPLNRTQALVREGRNLLLEGQHHPQTIPMLERLLEALTCFQASESNPTRRMTLGGIRELVRDTLGPLRN